MKSLYPDGEPVMLGDSVVIGSDEHGLHGVIVAIIHDDKFSSGYESWSKSKDHYPRGVLVHTSEAGLFLYDTEDFEGLQSFRKLSR